MLLLPPPPPPSPLSLAQRPRPWQTQSFPTLQIDRLLSQPIGRPSTARGPQLKPILSGANTSAPPPPVWHQIPSPSLTVSRSPSICDADVTTDNGPKLGELERILGETEPDFHELALEAQAILDDDRLEPAYPQGWYQPSSEYSTRLEQKLAGMTIDETVLAFFYRNLQRALYGDRVTFPRRPPLKDATPSASPDPSSDMTFSHMEERSTQRDLGQSNHRRQEEARRNRHRDCQHDSHERCAEIAAACGAEYAKEKKDTKIQAGKGPGKDEQLYAAVFMKELSGRVVQQLNDKRRKAEKVARLLLDCLQRQQQQQQQPQQPQHKPPVEVHDPPLPLQGLPHDFASRQSDYVGVKRAREDDDGLRQSRRKPSPSHDQLGSHSDAFLDRL
jgi:hypothetical protein